MAWNPHKMLMAGIQCCAFLVKDKSVSFPLMAFIRHGGGQITIFSEDPVLLVFYTLGQR